MSQDLITARKLLAGLNTHLKQDKVLPATQALYQAVVAVCKNPLLKAERSEFEKLIQLALEHLSAHKLFCQYYPLQIAYTPGKERDLAMTLKEVFAEVQRGMNDAVKAQAGDMTAKREAALKKAQEHIEAQEIDKAREIFDKLLAAFKGDTTLVGDIADRLIQAGQFRDAFGYPERHAEPEPKCDAFADFKCHAVEHGVSYPECDTQCHGIEHPECDAECDAKPQRDAQFDRQQYAQRYAERNGIRHAVRHAVRHRQFDAQYQCVGDAQ